MAEPLMTQAEYAARRNPLMAEINRLDGWLTPTMGRINSRAQELNDRMADHHYADRWQEKIAAWHKARLARLNRDYLAQVTPLIAAMANLDQRWQRQQIQKPGKFIREIAMTIGLPETANRDEIITRLREIMNPAEIVKRQAADCVQSLHTVNSQPRKERVAVGHGDRKGTRILWASKAQDGGKVEAFEFKPGVMIIPAGAEGSFDDAQRQLQAAEKREGVEDRASDRIAKMNQELYETVKGMMQ